MVKAKQESPSSRPFLDILPASDAPTAIPIEVPKNKYPPPISVKPKFSIAKGIIFNCKKAPRKRKKAEPQTERTKSGVRRQILSV